MPAAPCQVTLTADGAVIDWTVEDDRYILCKNGNWLATVTNAQTFTDPNTADGDTYLLRIRQGGINIDHNCEVVA